MREFGLCHLTCGQFYKGLIFFTVPRLKDITVQFQKKLADDKGRTFISIDNGMITRNAEARKAYLNYALSYEARWAANFRDLAASVTRLCTFAEGSRIQLESVEREIERLRVGWRLKAGNPIEEVLLSVMNQTQLNRIDPFDRPSLANAIQICRHSDNLSDAGRKLFSVSRENRKTKNDADRLKKYLAKYDVRWADI